MSGSMVVAAASLITGGAAVAVVGVLGSQGRLPRNRIAGVRTWVTMRSDESFEIANRVAGRLIVVGGALAILTGLVALALPEPADAVGVVVGAVLALVPIVVGGIRGHRAAKAAPT